MADIARRRSGGAESAEAHCIALRQRLAEVQAMLEEEGPEELEVTPPGQPVVSGPVDHVLVRFPDHRGEVVVTIGTSRDVEVPGRVSRISTIVDQAYTQAGKHKRVDEYDALNRLQMGDAGPRANRVLHLAFRGQELVGCASSTFSPGWTPEGCGHWGLLAVDPAHQGNGIATALVLAAERRLAMVSEMVQIEYQYTEGDENSTRLMAWYEDKLGFHGGPRPRRPGCTTFRRCHKLIPEGQQRRGRRRRLEEIGTWMAEQLARAEAAAAAAAQSPSADPAVQGCEDVAVAS
mmetsp:Transcript_1713/g.5516  ORF Transcript_1713/g.5516 Transcript_1713/m.5516 type:complete len:291 (+) Transcript_1713:105-977(+)